MSEQTCTLSYRTCRNLPVSPTAFCWKIAPMQQPGNPLTSANRVRTHLRQKNTLHIVELQNNWELILATARYAAILFQDFLKNSASKKISKGFQSIHCFLQHTHV